MKSRRCGLLISYFERRTALRPRASMVIDARCGDVRVTEPLLHLGGVRFMVDRVGGGASAIAARRYSRTSRSSPAAP
jgi:hypothetical protein